MTLGEKVVIMLAAKTDVERKAAIANLTETQKDIVITSLLRFIQEQGVSLSNINLSEG